MVHAPRGAPDEGPERTDQRDREPVDEEEGGEGVVAALDEVEVPEKARDEQHRPDAEADGAEAHLRRQVRAAA